MNSQNPPVKVQVLVHIKNMPVQYQELFLFSIILLPLLILKENEALCYTVLPNDIHL